MEKSFIEILKKKKGILLITVGLLVGIFLVFSENDSPQNEADINQTEYIENYVQKMEEKLEALIEKISGTSNVNVLITLKSGSEYVYASDASDSSEKHVVVGSELVYVKEYLPEIEGVAVVCKGGADPTINAKITELVCSVTGLYTTHVYVTE